VVACGELYAKMKVREKEVWDKEWVVWQKMGKAKALGQDLRVARVESRELAEELETRRAERSEEIEGPRWDADQDEVP